MASTFSPNLSIELIGTGDQAGTWGTTTNSNLGTLIEQAISGYVTQAVATGTDTTITIPNGSTGVARNMYIELTGTGGASTNLIVPANKKLYFIFNNSTGAVTVKVSGQTGVSVPTGKKMVLVSNGTDIVNGLNYIADFGTNSFSVTNLTASSATITNLIATSGSITNLVSSDASATVLRAGSATLTHLSATSASITNLALTSLTISSLSITNVSVASVTVSSNLTLSGGTANGVLYLNGSKVATSGSALTFDGTKLVASGGNEAIRIASGAPYYSFYNAAQSTQLGYIQHTGTDLALVNVQNGTMPFYVNNAEGMRLTSTGLGIGTSSPGYKLTVQSAIDTYAFNIRDTIGNERVLIGSRSTAPIDNITPVQMGNDNTGNLFLSSRTNTACGINFYTTAGTTASLRATLDSSGNLGIGTSSPGSKLEISASNPVFTIYNTNTGDNGITWESDAASGASRASLFLNYVNAELRMTAGASGGSYFQSFYTNGSERMRLDSSGNLIVNGTTAVNTDSSRGNITINGSSGGILNFTTGGAARGYLFHTGTNLVLTNLAAAGGYTSFEVNGSERARITSGGDFGIGNTNPLYRLTVDKDTTSALGFFTNSNNSTPNGISIDFSAASPDNNTQYFLYCEDSTTARVILYSDGDGQNHDNSWGGISDERLKQDIVDANSQWDDIKNLRVRKYRFKSDVENGKEHAQIGLIAQEVMPVSPGLVIGSEDTQYGVQYSILYMKAVKALQEAMARIEQLEAKVAALESK